MSARHSLFLPLSLAVSLCSIGCDDSLKDVTLIEETRVLGARVESDADPAQATPAPGEPASLRLFVAATNGEPNFSYALSLCAVQETNLGFPPCENAPFASAVQVDPGAVDARVEFSVPDDVDLQHTPHAFARGLVCPDSSLILGPDGSQSCAIGSGKEVAFEFPLGGAKEANRNPGFVADAFLLDGEPWPASTETSCDSSALPRVTAKSLHGLRVTLPESDFEFLEQANSIEPARETLLVSNFVTAGKLDHGFLALSADTPAEQRRVDWVAPALTDGTPTLVRFYFVVRDARSGEDFTSRALCVVP
ncbi:MAG TPA: hypothetical protein VER11_05105 [Polyangiaceae bacterium]|nr:hypothetical protein [Polyangiaceae bacterium]